MNKKQWTRLSPLLDKIKEAAQVIIDAQQGVEELRDEEQQKLDNMEEKLQGTEKYTKIETMIEYLTAIVDHDMEPLADACTDVEGEQ